MYQERIYSAGEYAIIPIDEDSLITNAVMTPNDSAAFIWTMFQEPSTIEDVVEKAMEEYDGMQEQIRADVERFVQESLNLRILEVM